MRRCRSAGSGAEPETQSRNALSSRTRDERAKRSYIVGTPKKSVACSARAASSTASGSNRGCSTTDAPRQQRAVQTDTEPVHVEQREREHEPIVGLPPPRQLQRGGAREHVAVGEERALGRAGGARRVAEHRAVVGRARVECGRFAVGELDVGRDHEHTRRVRPRA